MADFDVIITGAAGNIGKSLVNYYRNQGYRVADLDIALGHNLADESFVQSWFRDNSGRALVNCFALNDHVTSEFHGSTFVDLPLKKIKEILDINVVALFSVCREFVTNNKFGAVVNFSSIYSKVSPRPELYGGGEKNIAYGVSKAAANQLTRHLAVHTAPNFSFNSIILGGVESSQNPAFSSAYSQNTPMGRMAQLSDIYAAVDFLISKTNTYVTGTEIVVDGGWLSI